MESTSSPVCSECWRTVWKTKIHRNPQERVLRNKATALDCGFDDESGVGRQRRLKAPVEEMEDEDASISSNSGYSHTTCDIQGTRCFSTALQVKSNRVVNAEDEDEAGRGRMC